MLFKAPQGPLKDKIMIYKAKAMGTRIRMFREWILWLFWSETFLFISKPKPDVCVRARACARVRVCVCVYQWLKFRSWVMGGFLENWIF